MSSFHKANRAGKEGELMWEDYLKEKGHNVLRSDDVRNGVNLYWDLEIDSGTRFEVKYDLSAYDYYYKRPEQTCPNLFIECWSKTRNEPSGLYSSLGEADIFVYIMKHTDEEGRHLGNYAYSFWLEPFLVWVETQDKMKGFKRVPCSNKGDNNAEGWLVEEELVNENKIHNGYINKIELGK